MATAQAHGVNWQSFYRKAILPSHAQIAAKEVRNTMIKARFLFSAVLLTAALAFNSKAAAPKATDPKPPHILLFLSDDQGWMVMPSGGG